MSIKYKVGKKYKCKNGMDALIVNHRDKIFPRDPYPVSGKILNKDGSLSRIASWTINGIYNIGAKSEYDIIN